MRTGQRILRFTGGATSADFQAAVANVSHWYHSFYFDNGYQVRGDYDIGRNIDDYGFGDVDGLEVLDVGAASGWFAFHLEQQGATVTAFDLTSSAQFDTFGRYAPPAQAPPDADFVRGADVMRDLLDSRVERAFGRVYDLPAVLAGRTFDLVFMGALLMHLRDPIGALMAARAVCRGRLLATNCVIPDEDPNGGDDRPIVDMPTLSDSDGGRNGWWRPNRAATRLWLQAAGFTGIDVSRTVTLTADVEVSEHYNSTQTLLLADGHV